MKNANHNNPKNRGHSTHPKVLNTSGTKHSMVSRPTDRGPSSSSSTQRVNVSPMPVDRLDAPVDGGSSTGGPNSFGGKPY